MTELTCKNRIQSTATAMEEMNAAAAKQQSVTSEEINHSLEEISCVATDTKPSVAEAQKHISSLNVQMNNLNGLIRQLKNA